MRLFEQLTPSQVQSILDTLTLVGNPLYPTVVNTRISEKDRKKLYSSILSWDMKTIAQMIAHVTTPEFAKAFIKGKFIGKSLKIVNGQLKVDIENNLGLGCMDIESLPLVLACIAFMFCSKTNNGKVLYPKNNKEIDVPTGADVLHVNLPKHKELESISNKGILYREDLLTVEEQMAYKVGSVIKTYASPEDVKNANSLLWELEKAEGSNLKFHKGLEVLPHGVAIIQGYCIAKIAQQNHDAKFIVSQKMMDWCNDLEPLKLMLDAIADRIYYVSPTAPMPWYSIDFRSCDLVFLANMMSACSTNNGKRNIEVDLKNHKIIFCKRHFSFTKTLVRDDRGRWAHNTIIVPKGSLDRDTYHINSYGSVICGLIESYADILLEQRKYATQLEGCGSSWVRDILKQNIIPFNSEEECGGLDSGDRHHHLRFNSYPYQIQRYSPYQVTKAGAITRRKVVKESGVVYPARTYAQLSSSSSVGFAKEFFLRHNLVHMQKAKSMYLFDGRLLGLPFPHLLHITKETHGVDGVELYIDLAKYTTGIEDGVKALKVFNKIEHLANVQEVLSVENINKNTDWFFNSEYLLAKFLMMYHYSCIVTKLNKNTQRVGLELPSHAIGLDMKPRRISIYEQIGGNYLNLDLPIKGESIGTGELLGNSLGQVYSVISLRNAIAPPGMGYLFTYIREILQPTKQEDRFELAKYNSVIVQTEANPVISIDDSTKTTVLNYKECETTYPIQSGKNIEFYGTLVQEDELLFELPYKNETEETLVKQVFAKEEMIVSEIKFTTNEYGTLQWEIIGYIIRSKAKLRQLVKLMITPHYSSIENKEYPDVVYNCLNTTNGKFNVPKVDGLLTGDADKCKDSGKSYCDVAVETFVANGLTQYIETINNFMGNPRKDSMVWNQFLAMNGLYDSLLNKLVEFYGRSIWLKQVDVHNGMLKAVEESYLNKLEPSNSKHLWVQRDLNWLFENNILSFQQAVEIGLVQIIKTIDVDTNRHVYANTPCTIISSNITGTQEITEFDEIFIHYQVEDKHIMWQRTFGFVGNETYGNVYINLKVEMSLLDQNISESYSMFSTAQCLDSGLGKYKPNHKLASALLEIGRQNSYKWAAIQAMLQGQAIYCDGEEVKVIKVFGSNGLSNDFKSLLDDEFIASAKANTLDFLTIAKRFEKVILDLNTTFTEEVVPESAEEVIETEVIDFDALDAFLANDPTGSDVELDPIEASADMEDEINLITDKNFRGLPKIWLPAIYAQSSNTKGDESDLSTVIYEGIMLLIQGVSQDEFSGRMKRTRGACQSLMNSPKARKRCYSGRKGLGIKIHAVLNVPVHQIWIAGRYGENIEKATRRIIGKQGVWNKDGKYVVAVARSPISMPGFVEVVLITPDDPRYILFRGAHVIGNPLLGYISGGDFDGDMYILIFLSADESADLTLLTPEDVYEIILLRTGVGAVDKTQEAYICDHWFPKTWKKQVKQVNGKWVLKLRAYNMDNFCSYNKVVYEHPVTGNLVLEENSTAFNPKLMDDILLAGGINRTRNIAVGHYEAFVIDTVYNLTKKITVSRLVQLFIFTGHTAIVWLIMQLLKTGHLNNYSLVGWELYEGGPLGGLAWLAFKICGYLGDLMTTGTSNKIVLSSDYYAQGLHGKYADLFDSVAMQYYDTYNALKTVAFVPMKVEEFDSIYIYTEFCNNRHSLEQLIKVVSTLNYRIARGVFDPIYRKGVINIDLALAIYVWYWGVDGELDYYAEDCLALKHLLFYLRTCLTAFNPQIANILKYRPSGNPFIDKGAIYIPSLLG